MQEATERKERGRRRGLFGKYVAYFVGLVVFVLAVNGGLETWFMYRETTNILASTQSERADTAARRIEQFVTDIERQISWATRASADTIEQRRADYALLLQQVPAIDRIVQLDGAGKEQLRLTRREAVVGSGIDYSGDQRFTELAGRTVWLSPVYFDGLDPFMAIAMAHSGRNAGSTVAEVNLKFLSIFVDQIQIGKGNDAYVVGPTGRLLAHSDPERRLGSDFAELPQVAAMVHTETEPTAFGKDLDGRSVLTAGAEVPRLKWYVFFDQPLSKALQPVYEPAVPDRLAAGAGHRACRARRHAAGAPDGHADSRPAGRRAATGSERFRPPHRGAHRRRDRGAGRSASTEWRTSCRNPMARSSRRSRSARAILRQSIQRIEGARGDRPRRRVVASIPNPCWPRS